MTDPRQDRKTVATAYLALHKDLVDQQTFRSCLNCLHFDAAHPKAPRKTESCLLYKTLPPARVIVFSCGAGWEADIPF